MGKTVRFSTSLAVLVLACGGTTSSKIDGGADAGSDGSSGGGSAPAARDASVEAAAGSSGSGKVSCGDGECNVATQVCCVVPGGNDRPSGTCQAPNTACSGVRLTCDEAADCAFGEVCCTEPADTDGPATACRPSCVTGLPRTQVCKTDAECGPSGACRPFDCRGRFGGLTFCSEPDRCNEGGQ